MSDEKPPCPPFTAETARQKVKAAQHLWNSQDPPKVALGYTEDTVWRNRDRFIKGREEVIEFLTAKWNREKRYKLRKELFAFTDNKIAVQFWYEYYNEGEKQWYRCYGLEDWTFAPSGHMAKRQMSANDVKISEEERWFQDGVAKSEWDEVTISEKHW